MRLAFHQVDTDHLLLGLLHEQRGLANRLLQRQGLHAKKLRLAVEHLSGRGYSLARQEELVFAPGTLRVLARLNQPALRLVESQDLFKALLEEPDTVAQRLLAQLGLEREPLLEAFQALAAQSEAEQAAEHAEELPLRPRRFARRLLTPAAQSVLSYAYAAARFYGHTIVGTEQLFTGLLYVRSGLAAKLLEAHGVDPLEVEAVAYQAIGRGSGTMPGRLKLSRWSEEVCENAWAIARAAGLAQVGTGHLLLALLDLDVGGALFILDQLEVSLVAVRDDLEQAFRRAPGQAEPDGLAEPGEDWAAPTWLEADQP